MQSGRSHQGNTEIKLLQALSRQLGAVTSKARMTPGDTRQPLGRSQRKGDCPPLPRDHTTGIQLNTPSDPPTTSASLARGHWVQLSPTCSHEAAEHGMVDITPGDQVQSGL